MTSRRSFLHSVAVGATSVALGSVKETQRRAFDLAPRIRRNFNSLDPNGPEVAALRAGVKSMKALNPATGVATNPKSWLYQRGIHKVSSPAPNPLPVAWNTCTHHGFPGPGFVSWHRAYVYYFERMCRVASGDDTFTLPYWNYDLSGQNIVPQPFLTPATGNPLYHSPRDANDGSQIDPIFLGEGGTVALADFSTFQDALQACHDNTHGAIGGDMGFVPTSALDPIFYLHHCNIDRCWRHWQIQHQHGADPSPLPVWWNTAWTFFDETGTAVQITGQQVEHTPNLGYVYDDEPARFIPLPPIQIKPRLVNLCQRYPILCRRLQVRLQGPWPLPLNGNRPTVLPVRLPVPAIQALWTAKRELAPTLHQGLLALELVIDWKEGGPPIVVETRPTGRRDTGGWIRAGAGSSFARGGNRDTIQIDVSRVLDRLDRNALNRELEWRLRFTSGRLERSGQERPLRETLTAEARILGAQLTIPQQSLR
jgi:hypothetical protein